MTASTAFWLAVLALSFWLAVLALSCTLAVWQTLETTRELVFFAAMGCSYLALSVLLWP